MRILKRWSVLDCRTHPAEGYKLYVMRRRDNSLAVVKREDDRLVTLWANPNASVQTCIHMAKTHINHIRKHSCVVLPFRRKKHAA